MERQDREETRFGRQRRTRRSSWQIKTNTSSGTHNGGRSPCLAYYDETTGDLLYAVYAPTSSYDFVVTAVDTQGDVGMHASLAFHAGDAHISYYDADNDNLKFVEQADGAWQGPVVVDSAGDVGEDSSIALEADGDAHIAYTDDTNDTVKHTYQADGVWQAPEMISAGSFPSLVLDHDGHPRITFSAASGLMYADRDADGWNPPHKIYGSGGPSSLALDGQGYPQVAFFSGGTMYYAFARDASLVYLPLVVKQ